MKRLIICISLIASLALVTLSQSDAESAKHADLMSKTARSLEVVDSTITDIVEVMSKMDVGSMFAKLSKGLSMLGPVFMALSTILSVVSIFVPEAESEEMKALRQGFEKVNSRLDGLKSAIAEIKLISEISSAKSGLSHAFDAIDVMEVEVTIARKRGSQQAWGYFIKRFEKEYQHAAETIYHALSNSEWDADFRFDILDLFKRKFKCSPLALSRVCLVGMQSINRGIALEASYLGAIKYPSRVKQLRGEWHRRLETLRMRCGNMINECESQWEQHATNAFEDYYNENVHSQDPHKFAAGLHSSLSMVAPNKHWGVFASQEHAYGPMEFQTTAENGNRWQVRVAANGKNVIVWHVQKEESPINLEDLKKKFVEMAKGIEQDSYCNWDRQGKLYFATSGEILTQAKSIASGANWVVGGKNKGAHMVGPKGRMYQYDFPVTYCLTQPFATYALF